MTNNDSTTPAAGSYPDDNPKTLLGIKKVPLHLVPPVAIQAEAEAFADGAAKYGPYNWREKRVSASIYYAALMRHAAAWWDGEDLSRDAQVLHLGHMRACIAILIDAMSLGKMNDDRPPKGMSADWQEEYANKNKEKDDTARTVPTGPIPPITERERKFWADAFCDPVEPGGVSDLQKDLREGKILRRLADAADFSLDQFWSTRDGRVARYSAKGTLRSIEPAECGIHLG